MIKDSKLIGTKIKAPFGWQTFKVGDLFDKQGPITDRSVADFSIPYSEAYCGVDYINCATAGIDNNGCPMIVSRDVVEKSYIINNCITVSANGVNTGSVFVQTEDFCVLQDSYALIFKCVDVDVDDYLFVSSLISKYHDVFDYQVKATWTRLSELSIVLPVTADNQPDFEWMSAYIKVVKADYLEQKALSNRNEIEAYLSAGNVDSTDITDDDRRFLRDFEKLPRRKFKVGELFDVKTGGDFIIGRSKKGDIPLISHQGDNNGISCYVAYDSNYELFDHTCTISLADRGIFKAFCQNDDFYIGTRVKALIAKWEVTSVNELLYFVSIINKFSKMFDDYGLNATSKLPYLELELPVMDSSKIDVQSIEKYMQVQSKSLINKVAETLTPLGVSSN